MRGLRQRRTLTTLHVTLAKAVLVENRGWITSETMKVSVEGSCEATLIVDGTDITGTSSTTQPDNTTDATAAAKTTEGADSVDATVAHGMDAEDPSDTADITDADPIPNKSALWNKRRQPSPNPLSRNTPPPISPICSEPNDLNPLPELVVNRFPYGSAGVPVPGVHQGLSLHRTSLEGLGTSIWAPFRSQCDWEFAHWAKMRGPTSSAVAALLAVPQLVDRLELSYRNTRELDAIIDQELPGRPPFKCWDLLIGGKTLHLYYRDIIQCLRSLFGDPKLAHDMVFAPERHYTKHDWTCQVYSDMHTGDWWWAVQTSLESHRPGATVIPVILSLDKTQLTLFCGNTAYPVYMTIGNVPKEIRRKPSHRAQILMGYIPTTKLTSLTNKAARRRALANLFHACVQIILAPIAGYGETGVAMKSGDGTWCRCHPIFALFVGDYPEQILVMCTYSSQCPKCAVPHNRLGEFVRFPLHNYDRATQTYSLVDEDVHVFHAVCREVGEAHLSPFLGVPAARQYIRFDHP
ncbi:hypothetical protein EDB83DRAFT_2326586 [Lactarius deliciosus]|nr:hypothetical protein EDB83DRAFT_2326586 [Lactarius deliciosus]